MKWFLIWCAAFLLACYLGANLIAVGTYNSGVWMRWL